MLSHWLLAHHVWYDVGCDGPDGVTLGPRWICLVYLYKVPLWGGVDSTSIPGRCTSKRRGTGVPMTLVISGTVSCCCCCTGQGTPNKKQNSNKGRTGCDLQENKKRNYTRATTSLPPGCVSPTLSTKPFFMAHYCRVHCIPVTLAITRRLRGNNVLVSSLINFGTHERVSHSLLRFFWAQQLFEDSLFCSGWGSLTPIRRRIFFVFFCNTISFFLLVYAVNGAMCVFSSGFVLAVRS